jgi:hypothetical protein
MGKLLAVVRDHYGVKSCQAPCDAGSLIFSKHEPLNTNRESLSTALRREPLLKVVSLHGAELDAAVDALDDMLGGLIG